MISDTPVVIEYDKYKIGIIPVIDDDLKKNIDKNLEKMKDEGSNATILEPKTETVEGSGMEPELVSNEEDTEKENITQSFPEYSGQVLTEIVDNIDNKIDFKNEIEKNKAIENKTAAEINSSIKYKSGINDKIDIQYTPLNNGIKECIILNQYTGINSFQFKLSVQNLIPVLRDENYIILMDGEKEVGIIPAAYMYDSYKGNEDEDEKHNSEKVTYSLESTVNEGEYILTLTADKTFLQDKSTVYPVTIDPTAQIMDDSNEIDDSWITSRYANNRYGTDNELKVGLGDDLYTSRAYVKMNYLPGINSGLITSAYYTAYQNYSSSASVSYDIHYVTSAWSEPDINWNNQAAFDPNIWSTQIISNIGTYSWDVTNLVSAWYRGAANYGMIIKYRNDTSGTHRYKRFISSEGGSSKAYFTINYSDPPTLGSCWASPCGTNSSQGYVNMYWNAVPGAAGYKVNIFNGISWDPFDVGNTTSWTSYGKGIWPTQAEIDSGRWWLHHDNAGQNLANDPRPAYIKSGGGRSDVTWYDIRITAYNSHGQETGPAIYCVNLPDTTTPPQPVSLWCDTPNFSGPTGSITVHWSGVSDLPGNIGSGIQKYRLAIQKNGQWIEERDVYDTQYTYTGLDDNSTYQFAIHAIDNSGNYCSWKYSSTISVGDYTGPSAPSSFTISTSDWTNSTSPTITWSEIKDEGGSLNKVQYRVADMSGNTITGLDWRDIDRNGIAGYPASGSYVINNTQHSEPVFQNLPDGQYKIYIRGVDTPRNNTGADTSYVVYKKDKTAPEIVSFSLNDNDTITGTVNITATITNSDGQSNFKDWKLEYGFGTNPSVYKELASGGTLVNEQVICAWDTTWLAENKPYTLRLRVRDVLLNETNHVVHLLKSADSQSVASGLQIDTPSTYDITSQDVDVTYQRANNGGYTGLIGKLFVNNGLKDTEGSAGEGLSFSADEKYYDVVSEKWKFKYPEGTTQFFYVQAKDSENNELYSINTYETIDIDDTFEDAKYIENLSNTQCVNGVMKLTDNSVEGTFESVAKTFAGDISYLDLIVNETKPTGTSVAYKVSINGGTWQDVDPVSIDGGITKNYANRKHFNAMGNSIKLMAILTPSAFLSPEINMWKMEARYTIYADFPIVSNTFGEDSRGFTELDNTTHDETNGLIKIKNLTSGTATTGTIESTPRYAAGDVLKAVLEVDETKPAGTDIEYMISANGGVNWKEISPGNPLEPNDWISIEVTGEEVILKATLISNDGNNTPLLNEWKLSVQQKVFGNPYQVKLIDEPDNLSSLVDANYMTLLRWAPATSEGTSEGIVYNVYRSTEPYFIPSEATLAAEGLTENYWSDYNLNYGTEFFYKVTALKEFNGLMRESIPSLEVSATVVEQNETEKKLGLQNYWSFSGFSTGSGTGYVNVANGNLVYSTTDEVLPGPFFAIVMRRTFNSMADTKTPLGYGWDFSFNTCLMKEYDNGVETAMILKDGDGSFHRFERLGTDEYSSAKGTFMKLIHEGSEYLITRKDNVTYHFDDKSLKLNKFTEPHLIYDEETEDYQNIALSFKYDDRGNIEEVTNEAGEKLKFTYKVQNAVETDPDYTYINENVDMIESIEWTEDTNTNAVSRTFYYVYDNDRLTRMYTTVEDEVTYEEVFTYDNDHKLIEISDPMDKETDITYDGSGRISRVTSPVNEYYDFSYGTSALVGCTGKTTITNDRGVQCSYEYNSNGLVKKKTDPLEYWIEYEHNSDYLVTSVKYQNTIGGATKYIKTVYSYNDAGNITGILPQTSTDDITYTSLGAETQYEYYEPVEAITDNYINKPWKVKQAKDDNTWAITTYEYNAYGDIKKVIDPVGKTVINIYSSLSEPINGTTGYLASSQDNFGKETRYEYDPKGRVVNIKEYDKNDTYIRTVSSYTYDHYGRPNTVTDAMEYITDLNYDIIGRKTSATYADGSSETWQYDLNGNLTQATNRRGFDTDYEYDNIGRLTVTTYADGSTSSVDYNGHWDADEDGYAECDKVVKTDGEERTSTEYYDKAGRLVKSEANGTYMTYEYDMAGNMIKATDAEGREAEAEYDALGRKIRTITGGIGETIVEEYTYDYLGNLLTTTDGDENVTTNTYDDISRLASVTQVINSRNITTSYTYDIEEDGFIKNRVTTPVNEIVDEVKETWFDELGRKVKDFNRGDTSDDDNAAGEYIEANYTYNLNFQPHIVTRNDGTKEKYTYNVLGQTTRIDYYLAAENTDDDSSNYIYYEYDDNGNITKESAYHGLSDETNTYAYDVMDRVVQMTQGKLNENDLPDETQGGISINYDYDDAGNLLSLGYTKENTTRSLSYVYDTYGRVDQVKLDGDKVRQYNYRSSGYVDWIKDYRQFDTDGTTFIKRSYAYNTAGLMTGMTYTDYLNEQDTGTKKEEYMFGYNGRGFLTSETAYTNYEEAVTINKTYAYDAIGRLTQAVIGSKTTDYTYDDAGNRMTQDDGTDEYFYSYDQFNQLMQVAKNNTNTLYETYQYDGRGNQLYKYSDYTGSTPGKVEKDTFNLNDTLIKIESGADLNNLSIINTNAYNASGQRVRKVENGLTTLYYYSGSSILFTTNQNFTLGTENILDPGGSIIASKRFDGNYANMFFFYNCDYRGSTTAIIKPDGSTVKEYKYDVFGNLSETGVSGFKNEVKFTGSVHDTASGLQYMNARYYDSTNGRFLSQDTYSGNSYEPWSQHLYIYCGNNPTNFVDPTGHRRIDDGKSTGGLTLFQKIAIKVGVTLTNQGKSVPNIFTIQKKAEYKSESMRKALTGLADIYKNDGDSYNETAMRDMAEDLSSYYRAPNGAAFATYERMSNPYIEVEYLEEGDLLKNGGQGTFGQEVLLNLISILPVGGSNTLTGLNVLGDIGAFGPDWNPGVILKPGDVNIYVGRRGDEPKDPSLVHFENLALYGTEYFFRGYDLLYSENRRTNEVIYGEAYFK